MLAGCGRLGFSEATPAADAPVGQADAAPDAAGPTIDPGHRSGSRLHAVAWHVGDASQFARWFDMALNASCVAQNTTAGVRCVPSEAPAAGLFADDACTIPLYGTGVCVDGDARILTHQSDSTVNGYREQTLFTGQIYESLTTCSKVVGTWPYPLYTGGATHAASELPSLAMQTTVAGAVELVEEVSDDGARRLAGFADPSTGLPCHLDASTPGVAACVPEAAQVTSGVFGDPGCTVPAYVLSDTATPAWVRLDPDDACSDDRAFFPVLGKSGAYSPLGSSCGTDILAPGFSAYRVGAARLRASFPTGTLVARGNALAWVTDALDIVVGAWDPALQIGCYFGPSTAQHSRCYPRTDVSFANTWATDSSCGTTQWQAASCRPPQYVPFTFGGSACDFTGQTAGAIATPGATPYTTIAGSCAPLSGTFTKWDGGAVTSSTFAPADSVLE